MRVGEAYGGGAPQENVAERRFNAADRFVDHCLGDATGPAEAGRENPKLKLLKVGVGTGTIR